jgi:hypothetical protein
MVTLLLWIVVVVIVMALVLYLVRSIPMDPPLRNIVNIAVIIVAIVLILAAALGYVPMIGVRPLA